MTELQYRGIMCMPVTRRQRFRWAFRAFWNVMHDQPAASFAVGDGYVDSMVIQGPLVVHPTGADGKFEFEVCNAPDAWHVGWNGSKWVRT